MKIWKIKITRETFSSWMKSFRDSLFEWIANFLFSTSPLWVSAFTLSNDDEANKNFLEIYFNKLSLTYSKGELFGYSIAALAPVIYISIRLLAKRRYTSQASSLLVSSIVLAMISTTYISIDAKDDITSLFVINLSFVVFWFCLFILFLALFVNNLSAYHAERFYQKKSDNMGFNFITPIKSLGAGEFITTSREILKIKAQDR